MCVHSQQNKVGKKTHNITAPTLEYLVNEIKYFENIEKDIAIRRNKIETHKTKWMMLATVEN